MGPCRFLLINGEKYILILDFCKIMIVMEIIRLILGENFQSCTQQLSTHGSWTQ